MMRPAYVSEVHPTTVKRTCPNPRCKDRFTIEIIPTGKIEQNMSWVEGGSPFPRDGRMQLCNINITGPMEFVRSITEFGHHELDVPRFPATIEIQDLDDGKEWRDPTMEEAERACKMFGLDLHSMSDEFPRQVYVDVPWIKASTKYVERADMDFQGRIGYRTIANVIIEYK
jgi:hypothetical protein